MESFDTFELWWKELSRLAVLAEMELSDPEDYREYFDDGDSPQTTLDEEIDYLHSEDDGA